MTNPSKDNEKIINDYDYLGNACSSTDCTGLIPSAPHSEAELDSYEAVYHFEPPKMNLTAPDAKEDRAASASPKSKT